MFLMWITSFLGLTGIGEQGDLSGRDTLPQWEESHAGHLVYSPIDTVTLSVTTYELEAVTVVDKVDARREDPENISFVKEDLIRTNREGSLMKTLSRLPGISAIGIGSGMSKPLIRGLGFQQVMVVEHGIRHEAQQWGADHGLEIDQYAVDRLAIIKGPASIRYGSDAIAGVIDILDPPIPEDGAHGGSIALEARSNTGWLGGSAHIYGRKQKWFYEGRLTLASYGDFMVPADTVYVYDYGVALDQNRVRNTAGRDQAWKAKLGYTTDRFTNTLTVSNVMGRSGFFANAHGLEPRSVDHELHDQSNRDLLLPRQEVNHFKLVDRVSYRAQNHFLEADLGFQLNQREERSQYVNHGFMPANYPSELPHPADLERAFTKKVLSLNLRDEWYLQGHQVHLGVSGEWQDNSIGGWGFLVPAYNQIAFGIYGLEKFRINDEWQLQGAVRYDYSQIDIREYKDWFPSANDQENATSSDYLTRAEGGTREFNSWVWSLGFNYVPGNWSFKGNLGTGFRVPIAKELAANGVNYHFYRFERGDPTLSPERSLQLDLGAELDRDSWRVAFSPFFNYFPNYIYLNPSFEYDFLYGAGNQVFDYTQAEVGRYGAEITVFHRVNADLDVQLAGEYVYNEQLSGQKKGYALPFTPPPSAMFTATYRPEMIHFMATPYIAVDYRLTARQENIVPPEKMTPGYQLVHLRMGGEFRFLGQSILADFQVRNLFNTRYMNHTSFYRLIEMPEPGRSVNLALQLKI